MEEFLKALAAAGTISLVVNRVIDQKFNLANGPNARDAARS
jgi:hypothetical protein